MFKQNGYLSPPPRGDAERSGKCSFTFSLEAFYIRLIDNMDLSKTLSLSAATSFVAFVYAMTGSGESTFRVLLFVLLPLACIWFSDELGRLSGISMGLGRPVITENTPGVFVAIGGWILLIVGICTWVMLRIQFP
ncbi:hypothetical protein [Planctomycetes bacterium CA13]|uniref:hypothetical protein n=1 Tax=Novipirellula herctigrandis TaxID=2527986 RepID=UPI0011B83E83